MNEELQAAVYAVYRAPESIGRIKLIEDAIHLADSLGEEDEAFDLRSSLIVACTEYGQFMKALVAFSWCLAKVDEKPEEFHFSSIIWEYQALLGRAAGFDAVSLDKLNGLLEDFRKRMLAEGASERNYFESMIRVANVLRDKEMAEKAVKGIKKGRKDYHCDCEACIQNAFVQYELYFGTYEKAMEYAQPLIDRKMSCNMVPLRTFGHMINYVHRQGDTELAKQISKRGVQLIGRKGGFLEQVGQYLIYYGHTNTTNGIKLYSKALPWALNETEMPWSLFHFHMGSFVLFTKTPSENAHLKIDKEHPLYNEAGSYDYQKLAEFHLKEAEAFAKRFDNRNGNTVASNMLEAEKSLLS